MSSRPMPSSFDEDIDKQNEGVTTKVLRKFREEPLIPLGCALTVAAFINAWRAMRRGDHQGVQRMFRARVAAQGFTVLAVVAGGIYYGAERDRNRELYKLNKQQKEDERKQRWIRELEVRDEEDRRLRERAERRRRVGGGGVSDAVGAGLTHEKREKDDATEETVRAGPLRTGAKGAGQAGGNDSSRKGVERTANDGDKLPRVQKIEGTKPFGSLGSWFWGSDAKPAGPAGVVEGQKLDNQATKK